MSQNVCKGRLICLRRCLWFVFFYCHFFDRHILLMSETSPAACEEHVNSWATSEALEIYKIKYVFFHLQDRLTVFNINTQQNSAWNSFYKIWGEKNQVQNKKSCVLTNDTHTNLFSLCRQDEAKRTGWTITLGPSASLRGRLLHPPSVQWQPKLPRTDRWVSDSTRPVTFPEGLIMAPGQQPDGLVENSVQATRAGKWPLIRNR